MIVMFFIWEHSVITYNGLKTAGLFIYTYSIYEDENLSGKFNIWAVLHKVLHK